MKAFETGSIYPYSVVKVGEYWRVLSPSKGILRGLHLTAKLAEESAYNLKQISMMFR